MTRGILVIGSLVVVARAASAQPTPPPPPVDSTAAAVEPVTPPPPQPSAVTSPPPQPAHVTAEPDLIAPRDLAVGIGFGYEFTTFMNSLQTPNIVSAAVRLPSGVTIEPEAIVRNSSQDMQNQPAPTQSTSTTELGIGALVKFPMVQRHHTELDVLGSLALDTVKTNPDGPDNDTRTTTIGAGWGVGIGYWITRHWAITFDATNPVFCRA